MITPMLFNINVKKNNISRYLPKKKVSLYYKTCYYAFTILDSDYKISIY